MDIVSKGRRERRTRWPIGFGVFLAALIVFCGAAVATGRSGAPELYPARDDAVIVYILDNGFHTDLVIPTDRLAAHGGPLASAAAQATNSPWAAIGWGDAKFYTETGMSFARVADGLRALFAPDNPSVIRVFGVSREPSLAYPNYAHAVRLSPQGLEALMSRMEASMTLVNGAPEKLSTGFDAHHVYFQSNETFSLLRLCNHWTSDMLDAGGVPTLPLTDGIAALLLAGLSWRAGIA